MFVAKKDFIVDRKKDKGIMFFSAGSPKDCYTLFKAGIYDILVSYYYLQKRKKQFEQEILPEIKLKGGLYMTDSGGYTFGAKKDATSMLSGGNWENYLNEYVDWLWQFKEYIYVAVNLDIEGYVGRAIVDLWNHELFKPLEKHMEIAYVAHPLYPYQAVSDYTDKYGIDRLKAYLSEHDYVGVNPEMWKMRARIYELSKLYKKRIHGFGWTSLPSLRSYPFFSVDSTTWLGGQRFGTSYIYDGKNFYAYAGRSWKYLRSKKRVLCEYNDINYEELLKDKRDAVNDFNLVGFMGMRKEYIRFANTKLVWSKPIGFYERTF